MSFFKNGNLIEQATSTATAGGTTTLTVSSKSIQNFTGSSNQTVKLPVATTLTTGQKYEILNSSTGTLTIQYQDASSFSTSTVSPGTSLTIRLTDNSTANGVWATASSSTGAGGTSKNYLGKLNNLNGNGDFELGSTTGWSKTHSTLDSTTKLPNQTSGSWTSASANLALTAITSGKLAGSYSGQIQQSSGNSVAGDMIISDAFALDTEDLAKPLAFRFSYQLTAGAANTNFSGTSANSFGVAIYDVTAGVWIQPAGVFNIIQNSGSAIATGTFQPPITSTQLRFAIYFPNASTGTFTMLVDSISVGPQTIAQGAAISDWVGYTPTLSNISAGTTGSGQYQWRRVGDSMEITGRLSAGGSSIDITGDVTISLPGGYVVDSSKLGITEQIIGSGHLLASGNYRMNLNAILASTNTVFYLIAPTTTTPPGNFLGTTIPQADASYWIAGSVLSWSVRVPIVGWSSNTVMSADTDTRVVAASILTTTPTTTFNSTNQLVTWSIATLDTHAAWNGTTTYTVPVSGIYDIKAQLSYVAVAANIRLYIQAAGNNIAQSLNATNSSLTTVQVNGITSLKAGDIIQIFQNAPPGQSFNADNTLNFINIKRLSGPATIAASESVAAIYETSAGGSVGNGTDTFIDFGTKVVDTHNSVLGAGSGNNTTYTSTWRYVVPVSGLYRVDFVFTVGASGGNSLYLSSFFAKNGTEYCRGNTIYLLSAAVQTANYGSAGSGVVKCNAGDVISIAGFQQNGASRTMVANISFNRVSITRVGN